MRAKEILDRINNSAVRRHVRVAALVVFVFSLGALIVLRHYPYLEYRYTVFVEELKNYETSTSTSHDRATSSPHALTRALPITLNIPKLDLTVPFEEPIGLNADKTIEAPRDFTSVAWYKYGPSPGEIGPAVVLGHVDSYMGAAVFYHLGQLSPGDLVNIIRADGTTATFSVTQLERYPQADFPTDKVYGTTTDAELRLITCTGVYDHGTQRYDHNLVVYAVLVPPSASSTREGKQ